MTTLHCINRTNPASVGTRVARSPKLIAVMLMALLTTVLIGVASTLVAGPAGASVSGDLSLVDDVVAPTVPSDVTLTELGDDQVRVDWTASSDEGSGVRSYLIYINGGYVTWSSEPSATVLLNNPTALVEVRATDYANNRSAKSDAVSLAGPDVTPPSPPADAVATKLDDGRYRLSWEPAVDDRRIRSYLVYVDGGYHSWTSGTSVILSVPDGEVWSVRLRAVDRAGNRSEKSEVFPVGEDTTVVTTGVTLTAFLDEDGRWRFDYSSPGYNGKLIADEVETRVDSLGGTEQQFGKIQVAAFSPYTNSSFPLQLTTGDNPVDVRLFSANRPVEEFLVQYVSNDGSIVHFEETVRTTYLDEDPLNVTVTEVGINQDGTNQYRVDLESYTGVIVKRTDFANGEITTGVITVYWFDADGERQTVELRGPEGSWSETFTTSEPLPEVVVVGYENVLPIVATAVEVG